MPAIPFDSLQTFNSDSGPVGQFFSLPQLEKNGVEGIGVREELLAVGVGNRDHETVDIGHGCLLGEDRRPGWPLHDATNGLARNRHGPRDRMAAFNPARQACQAVC